MRSVYGTHSVFTRFEGLKPIYGRVVIEGKDVTINGPEPLTLSRDLLIGITPKGILTGNIHRWSGNISVGANLQTGNTSQTSVTTSVDLARRTPDTKLQLDFLANYSKVNDVENENNDRLNVSYDIRLNRDWFVRPFQGEYYRDPVSNIAHRVSPAVGGGYYIYDRDDLEWTVSAGPGYQYLVFETVEPGQSESAQALALLMQSNLEWDITSRVTFTQNWQSTITSEQAGRYTQHTQTTLEYEIKHHLTLDLSFIWDYTQNPQAKSDGSIPSKSDRYLTVSLGVRF